MTAAIPWPASLAGTPAISVIESAIARQRLSHSVLLHGDDIDTVAAIALAIADRLLNPASAVRRAGEAEPHHFPPEQHPDCFFLRPAGKTRIIGAEATRDLIGKVQVTAAVSARKVAIIQEADRMNLAAANIFLKTLEEPPAHTTLLLTTTRPYALLPTIRSRVLHFRFPGIATSGVLAEGIWTAWVADYKSWLGRLSGGVPDKRAVADNVMALYGLIARFDAFLESSTAAVWKLQKEKLPPDLEDDEQVAMETGIANGIRARLLAGIEQATSDFASAALKSDPAGQTRRALVAAVEKLEHDAGLLRLNLSVSTALEDFLLSSLRIWTRR